MPIESATYISQLNASYPQDGDIISEGDNHIRLLKQVEQNQWPNLGAAAVTATAAELNFVDGVTSPIQTQLDAKGAIAGQTWTGTHNFTGATVTVPTATLAAHPMTKQQTEALVITATTPVWTVTSTAISKTLANYEFCRVTASGQTLTLPASPTGGATRVAIEFAPGITGTFNPGSNLIKGSSGTMTCNRPGLTVVFTYLDSTVGWVVGA